MSYTYRAPISNRGQMTILGIAAIFSILGVAFLVIMKLSRTPRSAISSSHQSVLAQHFTIELLEFFRSLNNDNLKTYLAAFPVPVPMCAHINILDRATNTIHNADPTAVLPATRLDMGQGSLAANRYYHVDVVNKGTLEPDLTKCDLLPSAVTLGPGQTFRVTVRVKWLPSPTSGEKVSVLSTLLVN